MTNEIMYFLHGGVLGVLNHIYSLIDLYPELFFILFDMNILFCFFVYYYSGKINNLERRKKNEKNK